MPVFLWVIDVGCKVNILLYGQQLITQDTQKSIINAVTNEKGNYMYNFKLKIK
jgi:hypothetical protein